MTETSLRTLIELLRQIENHCPCGARPESPRTHPHVGGCPVEKALELALQSSSCGVGETPHD